MTGLFYNEYPPATSCLRSMTFGKLAGTDMAKHLARCVRIGKPACKPVEKRRADSRMSMEQNVVVGEGKHCLGEHADVCNVRLNAQRPTCSVQESATARAR